MSDDLHITFDDDVPPMAVDVVAPDFTVVKRLMMTPSRTETVSVPSENSFLRVYMPSGRTVTLTDPGNLERTVSLKALWFGNSGQASAVLREDDDLLISAVRHSAPSVFPDIVSNRIEHEQSSMRDLDGRRELRDHHTWRAWVPPKRDYEDQEVSLGSDCRAWIDDGAGRRITAAGTTDGREASWTVSGSPLEAPYGLRMVSGGREMSLRVPANVQRVWARTDRLTREKRLVYSIRLESPQLAADATLNYLRRGDFGAASAMEEWAEKSGDLLYGKMDDPYAAAVGGYLLLKLQRFDVMRNWARNLADRFAFLPDGCVIWAWQLAHQQPDCEDEIRKYLFLAVDRGLPVYTEGLRLLTEGLRLLGKDGEARHKDLRANLGEVLWNSPLSATLASTSNAPSNRSSIEPITFDIEFGSRA